MNILKFFHSKRILLYVDSGLLILGLFYFLFFVNKGLILADEGYYVHYAERIAKGEIPYKDFVLQYSPGYFYLLAFLYKIFGAQILVGRFISLFACLGILIATFVLLRLYKIKSVVVHILSGLTLIFLTYPLLHIPLVIWVCVLLSLLLVMLYILWHRENKKKYVIQLGIVLAITLLFRQNIGLVFILVLNVLLLISNKLNVRLVIIPLLIMNCVWLIIVGFLIGIYFLAAGDLSGIVHMFALSKQFIDTYAFSYPPLTIIFEPTGIFKLLPYYTPIIILFLVTISIFKKKFYLERLAFVLITLSGFFITVFPASDLLHVYPFLGVTLVSALVYFYQKKRLNIFLFILPIFILIGFYLTFFTKSYRYEGYFLRETTPLELPKTAGILIDKENADMKHLPALYKFIEENTEKNDYIFVYPFFPVLYFVLDRQNPNGIVQFIMLEAPRTVYTEERVINEITNKHAQYIITAGPYDKDKKIAKFIQQQKKVRIIGPYIVYKLKRAKK